MNLPNILTVFRIFLTFVFIYFLRQENFGANMIALFIFTLAALTDFYDGYYARKHNLISRFGKIMDPIADKFLMLSAFFIFMQMCLIDVWMFAIIFAREIIVTVLRLLAMRKGVALAAEGAGKLKTVLQIVAVYLIMLFVVVGQSNLNTQPVWGAAFKGIYGFMVVVVGLTLWSGLSFIWNNRKKIFYVG